MKYQSSTDQNIFFEEAIEIPISALSGLSLSVVFQGGGNLCFFFEGWKENSSRRSRIGYYLSVRNLAPFRLMEEDVAYSTVWKYLRTDKPSRKSNKKRCNVYRLWGTPYIKEMNVSGTYSDYKKDIGNKVFQIMIITDDETIELVMPKMEWIKYDPKKIKKVMTELLKKI